MKEVEKMNTNTNQSNKDDGNIWKPTVDTAGNGYAVIRFLPAPQGEDLPWVRMWNHGFQGPTGKWYIENSLTTLQQQDPVSELNSELWNSGSDASKEIARKQKRRLAYYANIMVVQDPSAPENEGKVFMYKFGKKIFDKIMEAMKPEFQDETPLNPFDFWDGVNFKLKIRQVEGYRNYDKSEFEQTPVAVAEGDEAIEAIWKQQHSLAEMVDPKNFKSYDELKTKLTMVLGGKSVPAAASAQTGDVEDDIFVSKNKPVDSTVTVSSSTDDDDAMSYFSKLAED
jgi:hypothetical protein|tara:strand:+ start:2890 stop:3738 length:849 start_codon:yes stop_codon:yes gene_type:complete